MLLADVWCDKININGNNGKNGTEIAPVYLPNVLFLSSHETQPILPVRAKQLDTLGKYAEVNIFTDGCIF
jgi:hypothetical protein